MSNFRDRVNRLAQRGYCVFGVFFLLMLALKWSFIFVPPVWDEAFSIFPAADFLIHHSFNYPLLLAQAPYADGGPTAHGLSLLTLVTAIVLKITGGGKVTWVFLHLLQWLMAAGIATVLTRVYGSLFEPLTAFLLSAATLVYPLMLAQLGYMYIEVPLLFFTVLAFSQYNKDRIWLASFLLLAACLTKPSGIIAVCAICLLVLFQRNKPASQKAARFLIILIPSLAATLLVTSLVGKQMSIHQNISVAAIIGIIIDRNLLIYRMYIAHIPEMIFLLIASLGAALIVVTKYAIRFFKGQNLTGLVLPVYNSLFIFMFSVFHFVIFALVQTSDSHFLSRYFFYALPSIFFLIFYGLNRVIGNAGIKQGILLALIVLFLINRNGLFYSKIPYPSIAVAERSEEYIDGYIVQRDYMRMIELEAAKDVDIFVSLPDYFYATYAVSGYVGKPLSNVKYIGHVLKTGNGKMTYPGHFILAYHYPFLGGQIIQKIFADVSQRGDYSTQLLGQFQKGNFSAYVVEVRQNTWANQR